jgi:selenide,water dikinase
VASLTRDDAAVYRLTDNRAIVATIDFFTPIVDDAYTFGAVAAANALSDLYAMGATPLFALNLVAWPRDPEILALVGDAVRGAADKMGEAGGFILGGHSIEDTEPKLGLVAVGEANPDQLLTNATARPGDRLVLTKPIGTGVLSTALKRQLIDEAGMEDAIRSMMTLNAGALDAARRVGRAIHAATDVTGFGLLGHLHAMLAASGVAARVTATTVPLFRGVRAHTAAGAVPGGTKRNYDTAAEYTNWHDDIDTEMRLLLCDAQTSGGLLLAVDESAVANLVGALRDVGTLASADIGGLVEGPSGLIEVLP